MLASGKSDLRDRPLFELKEQFRNSFDDTSCLVYMTYVESVGELVFEQVKLDDFEGMLAKRICPSIGADAR